MSKLIEFFKDVRVELSRVSWPTREQTVTYTLTVIGATVFLGIFLGGLDFVFAKVLGLLIR